MLNSNPASPEYPILDVIVNRWSPRAFSDKPLEKERVDVLLEAARFAPSSYNEQPWRYVIGYTGDKIYEMLADTLTEGNSWAKKAPVLMLSIAKSYFEYNGKPNRHCLHDTGAANGFMALQATAMDLHFHQMAGFDLEKARHHFKIPKEYEPVSMIAVGYPASSDTLPEALRAMEVAPRTRKPRSEMIWNF